jgi:hypothetical protein
MGGHMSNRAQAGSSEIVKYEVLFAVRTGVTVLLPCVPAFDVGKEGKLSFKISPDNPRDIIINANNKTVTLKDLKKDYLDEAVSRGFIMFYETRDDEVVRCTPCNYQN